VYWTIFLFNIKTKIHWIYPIQSKLTCETCKDNLEKKKAGKLKSPINSTLNDKIDKKKKLIKKKTFELE
jgi:hypothetical protein